MAALTCDWNHTGISRHGQLHTMQTNLTVIAILLQYLKEAVLTCTLHCCLHSILVNIFSKSGVYAAQILLKNCTDVGGDRPLHSASLNLAVVLELQCMFADGAFVASGHAHSTNW